MGLSYADSGVDRKARWKAKRELESLKATHVLSKYGGVIETPFNVLYPVGGNKYHVKTSDGVGTKVLVAQLAEKHDTIGIDAIAMVVNDCIRCGATPLAITDMLDVKKSDSTLLYEIQKGLNHGALEAGCPLIGGETADVPELLSATYHINCDCVGEVEKEKIITGKEIRIGDVVVGLRSSGIHSNGISLARRALFKEWGGKYDAHEKPGELKRELVLEVLEPTRIYVKPVLEVMEEINVLGAVHITGDAYLKFLKLGVGFEFDNFHPQPIFELIQEAGEVSDEEMFKTFNMGWGFALIVRKGDEYATMSILGKKGVESEVIGKVIKEKKIVIKYKTKEMVLAGD